MARIASDDMRFVVLAVLFWVFPSSGEFVSCENAVQIKLSSAFGSISEFRSKYLDHLQARPTLNDEDIQSIAALFEQYPEKEAMQMAFKLFLNRRLKNLSEDYHDSALPSIAQNHLSRSIEFKTKYMSFADDVPASASYNPRSKNVLVEVVPELKDSAVEYGLSAHEVEHYLQDLIAERHGGPAVKSENESGCYFMGIKVGIEEFELANEAGAMLVEGEFSLAIPRPYREKLTIWYEPGSRNPRRPKESLSRARLMLSAKDREEYVREMWKIGRYTPRD